MWWERGGGEVGRGARCIVQRRAAPGRARARDGRPPPPWAVAAGRTPSAEAHDCPDPTPLAPTAFQQVEVDYFVAPPDARVHDTDLPEAAILRVFGVTDTGASVCAFVHGFEPYFFVEAPPGFGPDDCDALARSLNVRDGGGGRRGVLGWFRGRALMLPLPPPSHPLQARLAERNARGRQTRFCLRVAVEAKKSVMHFRPGAPTPFLRIVLSLPSLVAQARGIMEGGLAIDGFGSRSFLT